MLPPVDLFPLKVNDTRKKVASTKGMQTSVATSKLLKYRAEHVVPEMIVEMTKVNAEKMTKMVFKSL